MIAAALLAAPSSSSSSSSKPSFTVTSTTAAAAMKTTEQQVRTLIPVTTSDGSKLFVSGPCIVLKTQTPTTVAQQMQALRPLLKSDTNSNNNKNNYSAISKTGLKKKANTDNHGNNSGSESSTGDAQQTSPGGSDVENEPEALRCKRRIDFATLGLPRPQPAAMARRNERERNRVKQVNMGFETLRQHVPQGRKNKKLSKVDTLKEAAKYIKQLHQLLLDADKDCDDSLTTAISDTITIVSRPSHTTTTNTTTSNSTTASATVNVSSSPVPAEMPTTAVSATGTSSAETNTAIITEADLLRFAASAMETSAFSVEDSQTHQHSHRSGIDRMVSEPVGFQSSTNTDSVVLNVDTSLVAPSINNPDAVDFEAVANQLTNNVHNFVGSVSPMAAGNLVIGNSSPTNFVELAPAQLNFGPHQTSPHDHSRIPSSVTPATTSITDAATDPSAMEVEQVDAAFGIPSNFLLTPISTSSSISTANPALHFMDIHHHNHHHHHNNGCVTSSNPTTPSSESSSPTDPSPAVELAGSGFQYLRKGQRGSGGSEGSCPVSPSESSGSSEVSHEDGLGMYGGETWQDLSADIAEWLCSKIDIEDPDVFV